MELSQKIFCLMDDDSYEWLKHWKWSLSKNAAGSKYARRLGTNPLLQKPQFIYLHKIVSGISKDYRLSFRDGNSLNLQRANMKVVNLRREPVKWWGSSGESRFTGVSWDKYYGLWRAHIKKLVVGYFVGEIEAAQAYNDTAYDILGDKAHLNDTEIEVLV